MWNVEHAEKEISDFVDERLAFNARKATPGTGSLGSQGEIKSLGDRQSGDMVII